VYNSAIQRADRMSIIAVSVRRLSVRFTRSGTGGRRPGRWLYQTIARAWWTRGVASRTGSLSAYGAEITSMLNREAKGADWALVLI